MRHPPGAPSLLAPIVHLELLFPSPQRLPEAPVPLAPSIHLGLLSHPPSAVFLGLPAPPVPSIHLELPSSLPQRPRGPYLSREPGSMTAGEKRRETIKLSGPGHPGSGLLKPSPARRSPQPTGRALLRPERPPSPGPASPRSPGAGRRPPPLAQEPHPAGPRLAPDPGPQTRDPRRPAAFTRDLRSGTLTLPGPASSSGPESRLPRTPPDSPVAAVARSAVHSGPSSVRVPGTCAGGRGSPQEGGRRVPEMPPGKVLQPVLKMKVDELFLCWLSEPSTQAMLQDCLQRIKVPGRPERGGGDPRQPAPPLAAPAPACRPRGPASLGAPSPAPASSALPVGAASRCPEWATCSRAS
ncbi:proline-rich proteoglycan 2-like [Phacochoerus africanus]|uniref:proline-rich proteoglycan 2-like n=1 Tax=Phacochoerus africanus TaxID=41426 RepID=UPI001FD95170|nr:proline-rich proteoglycan 2-like [Phacochoerus africanus]